jgi:hypothetical protein
MLGEEEEVVVVVAAAVAKEVTVSDRKISKRN